MNLKQFRALLPRGDLWVFGYGSLMWSPGFFFRERSVGLLRGYHRSLCILSTRYRGTEHRPGLVMGLCRGGSCWGVAYRIHAQRLRSCAQCGAAVMCHNSVMREAGGSRLSSILANPAPKRRGPFFAGTSRSELYAISSRLPRRRPCARRRGSFPTA